jgi:uncharacterized membrane protein
MYHVHDHHDAWWYGPFHILVPLLLIGLLIVGIVWAVRRFSAPAAGAAAAPSGPAAVQLSDPAVAELRMRYARGEIDREGYLQSFGDLTGRAESWPGQTAATAPEPPSAPSGPAPLPSG